MVGLAVDAVTMFLDNGGLRGGGDGIASDLRRPSSTAIWTAVTGRNRCRMQATARRDSAVCVAVCPGASRVDSRRPGERRPRRHPLAWQQKTGALLNSAW
jgi:hypothetical protein